MGWMDFFLRKTVSLPERNLQELKGITKILFIDDKKFGVVDILKGTGWQNTRSVKDVESLDDQDIFDSHIIFVDINGVGRKLGFQDEGLGLLLALRKKYPYKKLVIYSAERDGDRFHEGFSAADARLAKNADPFQFQALVEDLSRKCFSLPECISQLHDVLTKQFGVALSKEDVESYVRRVVKGGNFSEAAIARIFNLNNAGAIASIISLYVSGK